MFAGNGSTATGKLSLNYTNGLPAVTVSNGTVSLANPLAVQNSTVNVSTGGVVSFAQGQTSATVTMDDLALVPGAEGKAPAVRFVFHRQGNQSVYGDIVAHYAPDHGKAVEIGKVAGVAVYVPNATRKEQLPLTLPTGTSLHGGKLTVRFNERADAGGKLIAEATLDIP